MNQSVRRSVCSSQLFEYVKRFSKQRQHRQLAIGNMEGHGVTNYSTDKPSIGFTTKTTQFDDELLKRGVITFEQAMMAKGASLEEAQRLSALKKAQEGGDTNESKTGRGPNEENNGNWRDNDSSDNDEDDEIFREKWREMRISQIKEEKSKPRFGQVLPIQRTEWNHQVNETSQDGTWVIIHLSARNSSPNLHPLHLDICQLCEEQILPQLAAKFPSVKFITLPARSAVPNWPDEKLPTLFCYRYGKLVHQLVGWEALGGGLLSVGRIEWRLAKLGIIETSLEEDPEKSEVNSKIRSNGMQSHFGGGMATLVTSSSFSDDDYDDVD